MIDPTLPLCDLHRHLEGSVRTATILDLGRRHGLPLPARDEAGLTPYVRVTEPAPGVMAFIERFHWARQVMADPDACRRIALECVEDAHAEGLDYLELRFSPWFMAEPHGLHPEAVVEAVADGVAAGARDTGVRASLIGILSRTYGPDLCRRELEALLAHRARIVALDLAGDEARFPAALFEDHFRRAREAGWRVTVHAGEADGAASVRESIVRLGAERIGHAVRAADDPSLLDLMADRGIGIECNLTSNVQTSTVRDYASHPMRAFLERGLLATLNTDDPSISGIDLAHEYRVAAPAAGLTPAHIRTAQQNALRIAFLSDVERAALRARAARRGAASQAAPDA
uniref:adenosine deaminase n=1 Tax=Eiseniibacteriota bacterium TaxID=2212470 RepID=A0A832MKY9_UNCEI